MVKVSRANWIGCINYILISVLLSACASVSNPEGGPQDKRKPNLLRSSPQDQAKNYKLDKVEFLFDEPIQLNNLNEELIVTPTLKGGYKSQVKGNKVILTFNKPLQDNTTYFVDLRSGVKDLTEGNFADSCTLAFSTGPAIDSFTVKGIAFNLLGNKTTENALVGLYAPSDTLDIRKHEPLYLTRTNKVGEFTFRNLPKGTFEISAFDDNNKDSRYTNKSELLGYSIKPINVPKDTTYNLSLVPQDLEPLRLFDVEASKNKCRLNFNKGIRTIRLVSTKPEQPLYIKNLGKVIELSWPKIKYDSLELTFKAEDSTAYTLKKTCTLKFRKNLPPTEKPIAFYAIKPEKNSKVKFSDGILLSFEDSLVSIDKAGITLRLDSDTLNNTEFKIETSNKGRSVNILSTKRPKSSIHLYIKPNTFLTLHDSTNKKADTLKCIISDESDFGIIHIKSTQKPPFIIELLSEGNKIISSIKNQNNLTFSNISPGNYQLRLIVDRNNNGEWDAGNKILGTEPEQIIYYKEKILVKANWEIEDIKLPE